MINPLKQHHTTTSLAIATLIYAFALVSCVTSRLSNENPVSLYELNVDPLECTAISLRGDVPIKKEIIHEASIMPNRFLIALRYREGGDEKEFTRSLLPGYNNISLVSEVETGAGIPLIVHRRYSVIEMWRFYPEKEVKLCYLWTIGDDSVSMKVMLEHLSGTFLDERPIPLDASHITQLKAFHKQLTKTILEMLKKPLPDM